VESVMPRNDEVATAVVVKKTLLPNNPMLLVTGFKLQDSS